MNIKLNHASYDNCSIKFHKFPNGSTALVIYQDDQVLLKASVAVEGYQPPDGFVCIKNWSENAGILEELIENRIIDPPQAYIPSGFVEIPICKLLIEVNYE